MQPSSIHGSVRNIIRQGGLLPMMESASTEQFHVKKEIIYIFQTMNTVLLVHAWRGLVIHLYLLQHK